MIPKIIHYCWFSGDAYPGIIQKCMFSWQQKLSDYKFVLWDKARLYSEFGAKLPIWVQEAIQVQKWAFAADYIRLYALYKYGGIFLDTDCLLYRSFDDFLDCRLFIGRECRPYITFEDIVEVYLTSHCFGAEAGHPFLKLNLDYYQDRHFITCSSDSIPKELRFDMLMLPYIQARLACQFGYDSSFSKDRAQSLSEGIVVYPSQYFGLYGDSKHEVFSVVRHLGVGGWREVQGNSVYQYSLKYKIHWRIIAALRRVASFFHCLLVEYK